MGKFKKIAIGSLTLIMIFGSVTSNKVFAGKVNINQTEKVYTQEELQQPQDSIEILCDERMKLLDNYDENESQIKQIENELENIGMRGVEDSGKIKTYGFTAVQGNIKWIVGDYTTYYRGNLYKLHVIKGMPKDNPSPNQGLCCNNSGMKYKVNSTLTTTSMIIETIISEAIGYVGSKGILKEGITLAELIFNISKQSDKTIKSGVDLTVNINFDATQTAIYVREESESKNSHVLCYVGNKAMFDIGVMAPVTTNNGTNLDSCVSNDVGEVKSVYYDTSFTKACSVYYNARQKNYYHNIVFNELMTSIPFQIIGNIWNCKVPVSNDYYQYAYRF